MEVEISRSKVLQKSELVISKLVILNKPDTMIQRSNGQRNSEPKTFKTKVVRKHVPKTFGFELMKILETNVKSYPRQNNYEKILEEPRYYYKVRAHIKKKPRVTNTKGPIRFWVPKY